jgi:hypothetical protein
MNVAYETPSNIVKKLIPRVLFMSRFEPISPKW